MTVEPTPEVAGLVDVAQGPTIGVERHPRRLVDHRRTKRVEHVAEPPAAGVQQGVRRVGGGPGAQRDRERPGAVTVGERGGVDGCLIQRRQQEAEDVGLELRHVAARDEDDVGSDRREQAGVQPRERPLALLEVVRHRHPCGKILALDARRKHHDHTVGDGRHGIDRASQERHTFIGGGHLVRAEPGRASTGKHDAANERRHRPGGAGAARIGTRSGPSRTGARS